MIYLMFLIALANGFLVTLSRISNARLGKAIGPTGASVWNHATGFLFISVIVLITGSSIINLTGIPFYAYLGGVIGAAYVTISNFLIPKIGTSKATILMIAGQIGFAACIDSMRNIVFDPVIGFLGMTLIVAGVTLGETSKRITG